VDIGTGGYGVLAEGVPYRSSRLQFESQALDQLIANYKGALARCTPFVYTDSPWLDTHFPELSWTDYQTRVKTERTRMATHKAAINSIYATRLPLEIQLDAVYQGWRFNICVSDKVAVLSIIRDAGLFASGHYDSLPTVFGPGDTPHAKALYSCVVNLFNDRYFDLERAQHLVDVLLGFPDLLLPPKIYSNDNGRCPAIKLHPLERLF
jgi:hypothetical protein